MSEQSEPNESYCSGCRWVLPYVGGDGEEIVKRECHRYPPTTTRVPSYQHPQSFPAIYDVVTNFPIVAERDWCGEFQPNTQNVGTSDDSDGSNKDNTQ